MLCKFDNPKEHIWSHMGWINCLILMLCNANIFHQWYQLQTGWRSNSAHWGHRHLPDQILGGTCGQKSVRTTTNTGQRESEREWLEPRPGLPSTQSVTGAKSQCGGTRNPTRALRLTAKLLDEMELCWLVFCQNLCDLGRTDPEMRGEERLIIWLQNIPDRNINDMLSPILYHF